MKESLQKKIDDIILSYVNNLMDLRAIALANRNKKEAKELDELLKKIDL